METNNRMVMGFLAAGLVAAIIIGILVYHVFKERAIREAVEAENRKLREECSTIKSGYLNLLGQYMEIASKQNGDKKITSDISNELKLLKAQIDELDVETHIELDAVIQQMNLGLGVKAVRDLAKIVECKLREKAEADDTFKKRPTLINLLNHARESDWIKPHIHAFGDFMRLIRNEETHCMAPKIESYKIGMAIYSGIEILMTYNGNSTVDNSIQEPV